MPADTNLILTQGRNFSYLTTGVGTGIMFTTPSVNLQGPGGGAGGSLVCKIYVPAYTNADPTGPAVGAFSTPLIQAVLQVAQGNPATEANWRNLMTFADLSPFVPSGNTGAGTAQNPIFSNTVIVRFNCVETNVRVSGRVHASFGNFSHLHIAIYKGARGGVADQVGQ